MGRGHVGALAAIVVALAAAPAAGAAGNARGTIVSTRTAAAALAPSLDDAARRRLLRVDYRRQAAVVVRFDQACYERVTFERLDRAAATLVVTMLAAAPPPDRPRCQAFFRATRVLVFDRLRLRLPLPTRVAVRFDNITVSDARP